jgi:hypothetical protein
MNNRSLGFGVGITLAQSEESIVSMNTDPKEKLNVPACTVIPLGRKHGFDGGDFHGWELEMRLDLTRARAPHSDYDSGGGRSHRS